MLPDRETELESELLDARAGFRRIAAVYGVERKIPSSGAGWDELATLVEVTQAKQKAEAEAESALIAELEAKIGQLLTANAGLAERML